LFVFFLYIPAKKRRKGDREVHNTAKRLKTVLSLIALSQYDANLERREDVIDITRAVKDR